MTPHSLVPPGSTLGIVSPAIQASVRMPQRLQLGIRWLRAEGFDVRVMPTADSLVSYPSAKARAADLNRAFEDADAVLATVGGVSSITVIPYVDVTHISAYRKPLQGSSDITVLLWWLHQVAEIPAIYGSMVAVGLAEQPYVLDVTRRGLESVWSGASYVCTPSKIWTEERVDFGAPVGSNLLLQHRAASGPGGWRGIRPGVARGTLLAGCLEVIMWWLRDTSAWSLLKRGNTVLALDIALPGSRWGAPGVGGPDGVAALLVGFGQRGGWNHVTGLVVGRPRGYLPKERRRLDEVLLECVPDSIPILADFDMGHTEPTWALPLGAWCELDTNAAALSICP